MTPVEARELIESVYDIAKMFGLAPDMVARYQPIIGSLKLAAYQKCHQYEIWVWLDDAGNEHVTKATRRHRFGWSPDCLDRGFSFIDANNIPRVEQNNRRSVDRSIFTIETDFGDNDIRIQPIRPIGPRR